MKENITEKERFFSKVSHDLRGAFTSILGFSDFLNDPNEKLSQEEIMEFSKRIGKQSHETYELLVNFINWLKLENYDYSLCNEKIDLLDILLEVKSLHKEKLKKNDVTFNIDVNELEYVVMDYEILNSILNNILLFLLKACSNRSNISIKTVASSNQSVSLEFTAFCKSNFNFLRNIDLKDLNNDLSFPIIFAIKFAEQSGGKFNFSFQSNGNAIIELNLPK